MADAFAGVVMLLVAAGVFAQGLSTIGFINGLISIATSFGSASIILMLVLVILTMLAAMTTGSGNAPFYAFVENKHVQEGFRRACPCAHRHSGRR